GAIYPSSHHESLACSKGASMYGGCSFSRPDDTRAVSDHCWKRFTSYSVAAPGQPRKHRKSPMWPASSQLLASAMEPPSKCCEAIPLASTVDPSRVYVKTMPSVAMLAKVGRPTAEIAM